MSRFFLALFSLSICFVAGALVSPKIGQTAYSVYRHVNLKRDPHRVIIADAEGGGAQAARFIAADETAPLVVDLHEWSQDESGSFGRGDPLIDRVSQLGWNYVRPALAGPNNHPGACCSDHVLRRIHTAIDYAKSNGQVDDGRVYVVGASGGGYTALCAMMSGQFDVARWSIWVPIADLEAWYRFQRERIYGKDILACTASSDGALNVPEARKRSPLRMSLPVNFDKTSVDIYAGIEDGWRGSVPIMHSINMFNKLAVETGQADSIVDRQTSLDLLMLQYDDVEFDDASGRSFVLRRKARNIRLGIFEGAHEGLSAVVIQDFIASD